jgi:hypothetical protein
MLEKVLEILAWPAAIAVIGVVAAVILRAPLARLIDRIRKFNIGKNAIDATGDAPKAAIGQQKETLPPATEPATEMVPASHAMPASNVVYHPFEDPVRKNFEQLNLPRELERAWLCRQIAIARVERLHEINYRLILGSQLELMLLARSAAPPDEARARQLYDGAAASFPDLYRNFAFEDWVRFPINAALLYSHRDGMIRTTPAGEDFLLYLVRNGLTTPKAG